MSKHRAIASSASWRPLFTGILALACVLTVFPSMGTAKLGEATGVVNIEDGRTAIARDRAIDQALRRVVEETVGTLVQSDTFVENNELIHDEIVAAPQASSRSTRLWTRGNARTERNTS